MIERELSHKDKYTKTWPKPLITSEDYVSLKVLTATAVIVMSSSAFADIRVADTHNGAWVTVTENGQPAANATVSVANVPQQRQSYKTDANGRFSFH